VYPNPCFWVSTRGEGGERELIERGKNGWPGEVFFSERLFLNCPGPMMEEKKKGGEKERL